MRHVESSLQCMGSSSLSKDQIWVPCVPEKSLCLLLNCMPSALVVLWVDSSPWMVRVTTKAPADISASRLTLLISTVYSAAINASKRKLSPVTFWSPSEAFSPSGHSRPEKVWPCRRSHCFRSWALAPTTVMLHSVSCICDALWLYVLSRMFFSFLLASTLLPTQPFSLSLLQSCLLALQHVSIASLDSSRVPLTPPQHHGTLLVSPDRQWAPRGPFVMPC